MDRNTLIQQIVSSAEQDLTKTAAENRPLFSGHGASKAEGTPDYDDKKQNFATENPNSVKHIPVERPKTLSQKLVAKPMPQYESEHHINYQDDSLGKFQDPGMKLPTEKIVDTTMIKTASADELLGILHQVSGELVKTASTNNDDIENFLTKVAYDTLEEVEGLEKVASELGRQAAVAFLEELGAI